MRFPCLALVAVLSLAACDSRSDGSASESEPASSTESSARLAAIEKRLNRHGSGPDAVILVRSPTSTHGFLDSERLSREELIDQLSQPDESLGRVDRLTAEDFVRANGIPTTLGNGDFNNANWIITISEERFRAYWTDEGTTKDGWDALHEDFPRAVGAIELSAIGWSEDRSEGLIYVGAVSSPGIGQGGFFALRRQGSSYACEELIMAPSWITKANKPAMATPNRRLVEFRSR